MSDDLLRKNRTQFDGEIVGTFGRYVGGTGKYAA
jgi:hypothetical protein